MHPKPTFESRRPPEPAVEQACDDLEGLSRPDEGVLHDVEIKGASSSGAAKGTNAV